MNYLLDTHVLLWAIFESKKLSEKAKSVILNPNNTIYVSLITSWEISLKHSVGKLDFENIFPEDLPRVAKEAGFKILKPSEDEVASFHHLPKTKHKDPFDRLIIWQAIKRDLILISKDRMLSEYGETGLRVTW